MKTFNKQNVLEVIIKFSAVVSHAAWRHIGACSSSRHSPACIQLEHVLYLSIGKNLIHRAIAANYYRGQKTIQQNDLSPKKLNSYFQRLELKWSIPFQPPHIRISREPGCLVFKLGDSYILSLNMRFVFCLFSLRAYGQNIVLKLVFSDYSCFIF